MIQRLVDALAYPPTMQYQVDGLVPIGPLSERVRHIDVLCPTLFNGDRFLDVGASKGYFSLRAVQGLADVVAIEPGEEAGRILDVVLDEGVYHGGFTDYPGVMRFDRAFMGNVYHHITKQIDGYAWTAKLAALMDDGGLVVIEGPSDGCPDMPGYPAERLFAAMDPCFVPVASGPTTGYTPGRRIWVFRRKDRARVERPDSAVSVRVGFINRNGEEKAHVWVDEASGVCFKTFRHPLPVARQIAVEIAASSPRGTPILGWTHDGEGRVNGWATPSIGDATVLGYRQAEHKVWRAYSEHNAHLARLGYVDMDPGGINWFHGSGLDHLRTFDKSAVMPIVGLTEQDIDHWATCASRSYKEIDATVGAHVMAALSTRKPNVVQGVFEEMSK